MSLQRSCRGQPGTGKTTLIHKLLEKLVQEDGEGGVDIFGVDLSRCFASLGMQDGESKSTCQCAMNVKIRSWIFLM